MIGASVQVCDAFASLYRASLENYRNINVQVSDTR